MSDLTDTVAPGPDRPDTLECPSCGEPTDRRVMSGGVLYVCSNTDCRSLLYEGVTASGQSVED